MFQHSLIYNNLRQGYKKNRYLRWWMKILMTIYIVAIFANFIAPYTAHYENRKFTYAPPSSIHFFDEEGSFSFVPFIYSSESSFNEYRQRIYIENTTEKHYLKLFPKGEKHYVLGFMPMERHLFGVEGEQPFYLLGADGRGRDILSRILYGSRISLSVGLLGALITFLLGTMIGCISGFYGGRIDNILMRLCEVTLLVPSMYLLFALRALFPPDMSSAQMYLIIIVILSLIGWAGLARVIRGMVLSLKEKEFVLAAKALGQSDFKIMVKHIIPNLTSYLLIAILFSVPGYILGESTLSFLGLGIQDPSVSWGNMLSEAGHIANLSLHPWILAPALFLVVTILAFNILADFLRDILDPQYNCKQ